MPDLQELVQALSLRHFNRPFKHKAVWNRRLRSTGGRFFTRDRHIDINPLFSDHPDLEAIILHELVHYHLHCQGIKHNHASPKFKKLLAQVGGLRHAPRLVAYARYHYTCKGCGQHFYRQRRVDTARYSCGKCKGKLKEESSL